MKGFCKSIKKDLYNSFINVTSGNPRTGLGNLEFQMIFI